MKNKHTMFGTATPTRNIAQEKENAIMQEIRANAPKFEDKFQGTFFGEVFGISVKTN